MFCKKCGGELPDGARFCTNCGATIDIQEVETTHSIKTRQLRCNSCNAVMDIDAERSLLVCPSCGSKELIVEDKDVTIEKLRNHVEQEKQQTYREVELSKLQHEAEKEERQEEREQLQKFKKGKLSKVIIIFAIICAIFCFTCFSDRDFVSGFVALVQVILLIASWCMGMQFIKEKRKSTHIILSMAAFILIIPFLYFLDSNAGSSSHENETFTWPRDGLSSVIPQPESNKGYIVVDNEDRFSVEVYKTSQKDYENYLAACQVEGFTIDSAKGTTKYEAYNEEGYHISLIYFDSKNNLSIDVDAPKAVGTFEWPKSEIVSLLPVPKSNTGSISSESSHHFIVYVGDTPKEEYNLYVNACSEKGFIIDYQKGDDYYYAYNENGYYLSLKYEGFNIMRISIDEPSDDFIAEQQAPESSDGSASEQNKTEDIDQTVPEQEETENINEPIESSDDNIRPEFKAAMDSYEAFFDEYVKFMKKYESSTDTVNMLADYLSYMTQYAEAMEKLDEIDNGSLSAAEALYYSEVMARIEAKLLELIN